MSDQVNKEQTKAAKQEKIMELSDEQLDEAAGAQGRDLSVTGDAARPDKDTSSDPDTSDGIFVFTGGAPAVGVPPGR